MINLSRKLPLVRALGDYGDPAPAYSWMHVGDARRRWSSASKVLSTLGGSGGSRVHLMQPVDEDLVDVRRAFFLYPMSAAR